MDVDLIKEKVKCALRIRKEMDKILEKYGIKNRHKPSINPFYHQTDENSEGFICEQYYGSPSKIYTPLGYIDICQGLICIDRDAIKEVSDTFGFKLRTEAKKDSVGVFGPWYHITKLPWEEKELKMECIFRTGEVISYEAAMKMFNEILKEMEEE